VRAIRAIDPSRAIFFMLAGGGDLGMSGVDLSPFGGLQHVVLDLHDYYNGSTGSGVSADGESWLPSWTLTHNQNDLAYRGTEAALEQNLRLIYERTQLLGIPLVVGEWGVQTADSGASTYQTQMFDLLSRYGVSWARWTLSQTDSMSIAHTTDWGLNPLGQQIAQAIAAAPAAPTVTDVDGAELPRRSGALALAAVAFASACGPKNGVLSPPPSAEDTGGQYPEPSRSSSPKRVAPTRRRCQASRSTSRPPTTAESTSGVI
jgi:Cellulase (glycosyl hydrolase family 5)